MTLVKNPIRALPVAAALVLAGLSLSACATREYVDTRIAEVNHRVDGVDAKASDALARADAANAAAQAAGADARTANQRIDALTTRVDTIEAERVRRPRG